ERGVEIELAFLDQINIAPADAAAFREADAEIVLRAGVAGNGRTTGRRVVRQVHPGRLHLDVVAIDAGDCAEGGVLHVRRRGRHVNARLAGRIDDQLGDRLPGDGVAAIRVGHELEVCPVIDRDVNAGAGIIVLLAGDRRTVGDAV